MKLTVCRMLLYLFASWISYAGISADTLHWYRVGIGIGIWSRYQYWYQYLMLILALIPDTGMVSFL